MNYKFTGLFASRRVTIPHDLVLAAESCATVRAVSATLRGPVRLQPGQGQVEADTPVGDVCRQLGVSEATFYAWKKKYADLGVSELRRLRPLEDENARLKRLVADLTLDKHTRCRRRCEKTPEARAPSGAGRIVSGDVPGQLRAGRSAGPVQPSGVVSAESGAGS